MIEITQEQVMQNWNSETPLVSISCITYNHEPYIAQTLDGFLMQKTNFPFEVLIHDDASTDRTADIIREYEQNFPKIVKPIYQKENQYSQGKRAVSATWNFPRAQGKYIALCEGDDYWIDENKLQMQVDFLENNPEYGMCYTNFNLVSEKSKNIKQKALDTKKWNLKNWIISPGYTCPPSWCYRKELIKKIPKIDSCDGTFIYFAVFLYNTKVHCFKNSVTSCYRILKESASHSVSAKKIFMREVNLYDVKMKLAKCYLQDDISYLLKQNFFSAIWKLAILTGDFDLVKQIKTECATKNTVFLVKLFSNKIGKKIIYIFYRIKYGWK